ncbi:mitochondrial m-AAA+ ATPase [Andalucia godoyi]|uniref:Mitochondrial m-AAA+ ATPase n=1 Tax=Andalucia godoyi TaxID=505711 RepID=A0A8K0F0L6_ANDGO|nr:mitochondrial m-AAA+ ATPase [Andalucia godoyi]|eukprot:ANDGO_05015.mRNA.1 mitochondrial m-AAA+ ATPase [Yta10(Agf3)/Yta12(Rca1) homolog]
MLPMMFLRRIVRPFASIYRREMPPLGSSTWFARVPRGFEDYESTNSSKNPPGKTNDSQSNTEKPKLGSSRNESNGQGNQSSGGSNKGNNGPFESLSWQSVVPPFLALGVYYWWMSGNQNKEIDLSFQEFRRYFLEGGLVDRIEVVNEHKARVFLNKEKIMKLMKAGQSPDAVMSSVMDAGPEVANSSRANPYEDKSYVEFSRGSKSQANPGENGARKPAVISLTAAQEESLEYARRRITEHQQKPLFVFPIGSLEIFEERMRSSFPDIPVSYVSETNIGAELAKLAPSLLLLGFFVYMFRSASKSQGDMFGAFSKKFTAKNERVAKVTFQQVAGMDEAKQEVMEFVEFLKTPERFRKVGAKIPKGAILMGPPGTGKTLLAKATAGESGVPFFSISGSDFMEMFVGVGPARVRDLFKEARSQAPCIVYIDEIDAIGKPRGRGGGFGGNDERENTLNQLLVEMDGFGENSGVVVLASTNVPLDGLDRALTRPGRFDRIIWIDRPEKSERVQIFMVHLKGIKLNPEVSVDRIANRLSELTPGFAGAEIANVVNEGALIAARRSAASVDLCDFEAAIDRVVGGLERKSRVLSPEEKKIVAYHEAGHAVTGWFLSNCDPLLKVTIVPRGVAALGYAQYLPKEDFQYIRTEQQLLDSLCMALGGRAAEKISFNHLSTGAQDDLRRVTDMAYNVVSQFGMARDDDHRLANLSFPRPQSGQMETQKPYSEDTAARIDHNVKSIVNAAAAKTENLLREKQQYLNTVAEHLLLKEVLHFDDLEKMLGPRPRPSASFPISN